MFVVPIPPLIALGYLIGIVLLVLGYREMDDSTRRNHLMGSGTLVIGFMIPATTLAWYGYLVIASGLVLGVIELGFIAITVILGAILMYQGARLYTMAQ
jgi:hypothetical protein